MSTEIRIFKTGKELRDYLIKGPYRYCAELEFKPDKPTWTEAEGNIYCLTQKNEFLFAETDDELCKGLLRWDERKFEVFWYVRTEEDFDWLAPGWWELRADRPLPDWIQGAIFRTAEETPPEDTPIEVVARLARANVIHEDMGITIMDRENEDSKRYLAEWVKDEKALNFERKLGIHNKGH